MSESQKMSEQDFFCSDRVRGRTFVITNGPDADALCKALGEAIDARHPNWPLGYRKVDFKVFVAAGCFRQLPVAVTGLRWHDYSSKGRCTIYGFVFDQSRQVTIDYTLEDPHHKASSRTGRVNF